MMLKGGRPPLPSSPPHLPSPASPFESPPLTSPSSASGPERSESPVRRSHGVTYLARFLTMKHSWKGRYPRVFCVCANSILTLNPTTFEVTNEWGFEADLLDVKCGEDKNEFYIQVKGPSDSYFKSSKSSKVAFASEHRAALLTALLRARAAAKITSEGHSSPTHGAAATSLTHRAAQQVLLTVGSFALEVRASAGASTVTMYDFKDFESVRALADGADDGFVIQHGRGRLAGFRSGRRTALLQSLLHNAAQLGIAIDVGPELGIASFSKVS